MVITRDRTAELLRTLAHLTGLPEHPPVIVVDNGSTTDTAKVVHHHFPDVAVIPLGYNAGAHGRTVGARIASTPLVAFSDDDSWWAPGALRHAVELFARHPRLGLAAARVLVGEDELLDPTCQAMAASPLESAADLPGPRVLGFVACGVVVRREALLDAGGFPDRYGIGGEEALVAIDLARAGWGLAYVDALVAHHHPSTGRDPSTRQRHIVRNDLWTVWLRRPLPAAVRRTGAILGAAPAGATTWSGAIDALCALSWVRRSRDPVPAWLEAELAELDASRRTEQWRSQPRWPWLPRRFGPGSGRKRRAGGR